MEDLLIKDGKLTSWSDFKKEADNISENYNIRWLKTEYHHTVASANMAGKWKDFQRTKHLYPNLKYITVLDDRVRQEHQEMHGIIRPIDDPFWRVWFPPNDWGCRCDAKITVEEPTEKTIKADNSKFAKNPGITGKVFPNTIYEKGLTDKEKSEAYKRAEKQYQKSIGVARNLALFNRLKKDENYFDVVFHKKSGGVKATHKGHQFNPKTGRYEKEVAELLYKKGFSIILEDELTKGEGVKSIDGLLNNESMDISTILGSGKNTIKRALNHSRSKPADVALLYFPKEELFSVKRLKTGIAAYNGQTSYRFKKIYYIVRKDINKVEK